MNRNIRIARALVRIAKELAASGYDNAQLFQKAVSKPTSQNVGKFVKSITPKTGEDDDITDADEVVMPQFPGGNDALREYIFKKTGWDTSKSPVSVMVDVTINNEGKATNAVIKQGYNKDLDNKALKICRKLPNFSPATHHGKPIESTITVPVRFPKPNK